MVKIIGILLAISWFIYSYGFVDFNLTLSPHPVVMGFVGWSQGLAMFHRSTSVKVFLILLFLLYSTYSIVLSIYRSKKLIKFPWKTVIVVAVICSLAYPFLSSDVFKYLFSARMVIDYHSNPHLLPPNTFPDDTWIRFMRWVHTPSPYGPVMTGLAIPPYLLGLGKFVPTLYLFKLMQLGWYLLSVWVIGKLTSTYTKEKTKIIFNQLFFALNPLILSEWLMNAHNDAPMISLLLLSLYLLSLGKKIPAILSLALSIGIKYVTVVFIPFVFLKKINLKFISAYALLLLTLAPLLYHYSWQYQPWYVTWLIPFAAILGNVSVMFVVGAYTVGSFLRYLPFINIGLWEGSTAYFAWLTFGPPVLVGIMLLVGKLFPRKPSSGI